ncbi:MAG: glycine cleavage system protein H [Halobacteriovorax sp.]|nr:glycine cleavage system protein H [Halobacteriovorax sp.]|tara:strand:+ start:239912 stop:240301 length:390 start_codon:yes stop_codon:yes gene_type:complete
MSHNVPENLKYTKEHEWTLIEGDVVTIGITDFAQSALGDIVFVELPEVGGNMEIESAFGVVESIKSVSDLYAPLTGEVLEANAELEGAPELLNSDPYKNWIVKIKISNTTELEQLMTPSAYLEHCNSIE